MLQNIIKINNNKNIKIINIFKLEYFTLALLCIYMLIYPPFIFTAFVDPFKRIIIEAAVIIMLIFSNIKNNNKKDILWILSFLIIFLILLFFQNHSFNKLISFFNKITIFVFTVTFLLNRDNALGIFMKLWILFSYSLAFYAIITSVIYHTGAAIFTPLQFSEERYFLNNNIFGNISERSLLGYPVGAVTGYMFESLYLGFLFGYNIVISKLLYIKRKDIRYFKYINILAGITTFSTAFIIFIVIFILYEKYENINKINKLKTLVTVLISILIIIITVRTGYFEHTSASDRISRFNIYYEIFAQNNITTLLFGNGVGITSHVFNIGFDSGWAKILIEMGSIMLMLYFILIYKFVKYSKILVFYIVYYNFAIPLILYPLFYIITALAYAIYYYRKRIVKTTNNIQT